LIVDWQLSGYQQSVYHDASFRFERNPDASACNALGFDIIVERVRQMCRMALSGGNQHRIGNEFCLLICGTAIESLLTRLR